MTESKDDILSAKQAQIRKKQGYHQRSAKKAAMATNKL
jgi:hypothetical protein